MKKTFTINISGRVFHIDDDAHEKLNNYLIQLNRYFGNDPDAKEIVQDIESRISELFSEKMKSGGEVITLEHVEEVIAIMGMPEAISDTKLVDEEKRERVAYTRSRKLYRDPDDKVLGGVCSGLGAYFNLDPVVVRIIFILLVILGAGSFLLVYIILWIVVPKARNTAERLEMKGEEVNITNISKSIKEEFQDVKQNYQSFRQSKGREGINEVGNFFLALLKAVLKVAIVVIGALFVLISVITLISLILSFFVTSAVIGFLPWSGAFPHYFGMFMNGNILSWFSIGLTLVIGIPLIMLAYLGLKIIFRFKSRNNAVGLSLLAVWIVGLIILIASAVTGVSNFRDVSTSTKQEMITTPSDTLYLKMGPDEISDYVDDKVRLGNIKIATMNGKPFLVGNPELNIQKSDNNSWGLIIKSNARGVNPEMAQKNAKEILYSVDQKDSLLTFQPWYVIPGQSMWHLQNIHVTLKVPEGKTIYLGDNMGKIIHDIENTSNTLDNDMVGKYWTMKPDGLENAGSYPHYPALPSVPRAPHQ
jgi:phage shock protein PspC (stress-responsive transcriptional regulator)